MIANGTETEVKRKLRANEFQIFRENTTSYSKSFIIFKIFPWIDVTLTLIQRTFKNIQFHFELS